LVDGGLKAVREANRAVDNRGSAFSSLISWLMAACSRSVEQV
jgi:hypothetical protein